MDTDGGASLEDGRMPYGSPGYIGERLGEPEGIRPDTMASTAGADLPRHPSSDQDNNSCHEVSKFSDRIQRIAITVWVRDN